jgi:hypothetical protein
MVVVVVVIVIVVVIWNSITPANAKKIESISWHL